MAAKNENMLLRLNKATMALDPEHPPMSRNPKLHIGINPLIMTMRSELHYLKQINLEERRRKLKELRIKEFMEEDKELRQVGLAYIDRFM